MWFLWSGWPCSWWLWLWVFFSHGHLENMLWKILRVRPQKKNRSYHGNRIQIHWYIICYMDACALWELKILYLFIVSDILDKLLITVISYHISVRLYIHHWSLGKLNSNDSVLLLVLLNGIVMVDCEKCKCANFICCW